MTIFKFQKRFPTEAYALNFIVFIKYANGYNHPKNNLGHYMSV